LERDADAAERSGDIATALRLRYQAGLIRLDRLGAIDLRPSSTATAVARALRNQTLDGLTVTYERVAYGDHAPAPDELAAAKNGWATVLAGAARSS
jgi:hypothetical protein